MLPPPLAGFVRRMLYGSSYRQQILPFSQFKASTLTEMNLRAGPKLVPNGDIRARACAVENSTCGWKNSVSSRDVYDKLNNLERRFPGCGMLEATSRFRINVVILHAATRLPEGVELVGYVERYVQDVEVYSATGEKIIRGSPDYTLTSMGPSSYLENYEALLQGNVSGIGTPNGVFIAEAKRGSLKAHIPQLIGEMYGSVMRCGGNVIRGVLSNGREWMFTILVLDADKKGGTYSISDAITVDYDNSIPPRVTGNGPDVLANAIADWVLCAPTDLGRDDWFVRK